MMVNEELLLIQARIKGLQDALEICERSLDNKRTINSAIRDIKYEILEAQDSTVKPWHRPSGLACGEDSE